jgi:hypothetical protein
LRLRGTSAAVDVAIEKNTTCACWPWNLSTVPTRAPGGKVESGGELLCGHSRIAAQEP